MGEYIEFINNIISTRGQWGIGDDEYFESHHIIPRCLGGTGKIRIGSKKQKHKNIIFLYANEHYTAHKLLALENPDNRSLVSAWEMMAYPKGKTNRDIEISAQDYEMLRILWSKHMRENNPGCSNNGHPWNYGIPMSEERKRALSLKKTGVKLGKHSEASRINHSIAVRKRYAEHPETFVGGNKGKKAITNGIKTRFINSEDAVPDGWYFGNSGTSGKHDISGYFSSDEAKLNRSARVRGDKNPNYGHGERQSGGNNGHATIIYTFNGTDYYCRKDLVNHLKTDFPDISNNAIRNIVNGNFGNRTVNKFKPIIENLTWRQKLLDEDKKN